MTTAKEVKEEQVSSEIRIFGDVDRTNEGMIASQYPVYMHETQIRDLRESVKSEKKALRDGQVPPISIPRARAALEIKEAKLKDIERAKPHLSDGEKDRLGKMYKDMTEEIGKLLYTRSQMRSGVANPHMEVKRMTTSMIKVDRTLHALCDEMGVKLERGMVHRNDATKMWKIAGFLIEQPTNVEELRRD